jgi:hypothetical protein
MAAQEPGQADPVGPAALDRVEMHRPQGAGPGDQRGVAIVGGRDGEPVEPATEAVEGDGDVGVLMGVDTDDDIGAGEREARHGCCSLQRGRWSSPPAGREGQDCDGTWWFRLL